MVEAVVAHGHKRVTVKATVVGSFPIGELKK